MVYVMGGATFSEFRVGYEVSNERKNWEVIVGKFVLQEKSFLTLVSLSQLFFSGGSQILTPEVFLTEVQKLSSGGLGSVFFLDFLSHWLLISGW